jgi:polyisoprenoid-binding protein YceI
MVRTAFVKEACRTLGRYGASALLLAFIWSVAAAAATVEGPPVAFEPDPARTVITWTLGDVLHTVRGTFRLKRGELQLDSAANRLTGEVVVDAQSGESGSAMRDRKMHREILESARYPEIVFRPDRIDGPLKLQGKSSVQVHGIFSIHGSDHELRVPAEVEISSSQWSATLHFAVPYEKWGMKNPSTLFLRVSDTVQIDITVSGSVTRP